MHARIFRDAVDLTVLDISIPGSFKFFATCAADVFPREVHYLVFLDIGDRFENFVTDVACWKSLGSSGRERTHLCSPHLVTLHYYLFICKQ